MKSLRLALATWIFLPAIGAAQPPADTFTMALTGDSIITRKLSVYQEPEFLKMIELLRAHVADWNDRRYDFDRRGFPAQREIWESVIAAPEFRGKTLGSLPSTLPDHAWVRPSNSWAAQVRKRGTGKEELRTCARTPAGFAGTTFRLRGWAVSWAGTSSRCWKKNAQR